VQGRRAELPACAALSAFGTYAQWASRRCSAARGDEAPHTPVTSDQLEVNAPVGHAERNRRGMEGDGDSDFAYEIAGWPLPGERGARSQSPMAVFRVIPAKVVRSSSSGSRRR